MIYKGLAGISLLCAFAVLLAQEQSSKTDGIPGIAGVVAAGTNVELIREGFNGSEGVVQLREGAVVFSEMNAGRILKIDAAGSVSTLVDAWTNGLGVDAQGRLIAAEIKHGATRIGVVYPRASARVLADGFEGRPNDLVLDRKGGVYFTVASNSRESGPPSPSFANRAVYYIASGSHTAAKVADGIELPNGIQLSPDERTLYVNDSEGEYLLAFDVKPDGTLRRRHNVARYRSAIRGAAAATHTFYRGQLYSGADGLATDRTGRLYIGITSPPSVQVVSSDGRTLGVIPLPRAAQNLAFGGPDKRTLFIVGHGAVMKIGTEAQGYPDRAK